MPEARKKPCRICRRWFQPDPQVGGQATRVQPAGLSDGPAGEDAGELAQT
jgi:hypothetical protein